MSSPTSPPAAQHGSPRLTSPTRGHERRDRRQRCTDWEVSDMNKHNTSGRTAPPPHAEPDPGTLRRGKPSDAVRAGQHSPRPVVTLFESYGSGAGHIGPRVAQALGVPFHPQAFSSEEIERATTQRENQGTLSRIFSAVGGSYAGLDGPSVA